jgi:hypothetical protein
MSGWRGHHILVLATFLEFADIPDVVSRIFRRRRLRHVELPHPLYLRFTGFKEHGKGARLA